MVCYNEETGADRLRLSKFSRILNTSKMMGYIPRNKSRYYWYMIGMIPGTQYAEYCPTQRAVPRNIRSTCSYPATCRLCMNYLLLRSILYQYQVQQRVYVFCLRLPPPDPLDHQVWKQSVIAMVDGHVVDCCLLYLVFIKRANARNRYTAYLPRHKAVHKSTPWLLPTILHADWSNRPRSAFRRWTQAVHQVAAIQVGRHRFLACLYRFLGKKASESRSFLRPFARQNCLRILRP